MRLLAVPLLLSSFAAAAQAGPASTAAVSGWATLIGPLARASAETMGDPLVASSPMVEISKKCPQLRYLGRDATFEITIANRGSGPAVNVVVSDVIAGGTEFVSADNNGVREGNNIVWRVGTLDAGQVRTLKVSVRCVTIGPVRNTAKVTYCAEAAAECGFEIKGIPAILLECVDDPDPIEIGTQLTYTITVTNQGSQTGTNIKVECIVPPEQEFVKAGGATAGTAEGRNVKFATLPALAPKAKAAFTITVKGIKEADSRFRVKMMSDQTETPVEETESTHIYE